MKQSTRMYLYFATLHVRDEPCVLKMRGHEVGPRRVGESSRGKRIGATGLRASERKSASKRVSERSSEREGFQRF